MMKIKRILFALGLLPCTTFATVGGSQTIEVLGYEPAEQKVYLLRHYEDGRGRLPQLYYYQFKHNKSAEKIILVHSLYINPKTQKIDYDQDSRAFDKEILKIRKRLQSLNYLPKQNMNIHVLKKKQSKEKSWYDPNQFVSKSTYTYQLKYKKFISLVHQATDYGQGLKISQAYKIPNQPNSLAIVKYLGIPFETGYHIEDPVLLSLKK